MSVPLFHVTGCNSQLIPMLEFGGRVEILANGLDLDGFCRAIDPGGVNQLVSVPAIYHALLRFPGFSEIDVSGVRWVSYGGAPIDEAMVARIMKAFPNARVGNGFGLTETSSLTSFLPHEEAAAHADSVGFAMPVVDLSIESPDPETGVGELLVRGPNVVKGYWKKPEANAETFTDGWLHTGDLARVDGDGLLYIVDRKKDMINRGGENVYSIEVENVLADAPAVAESAVVAVPDDMMGEKVGAVLVALGGSQIDIDEVLGHCGPISPTSRCPVHRDPRGGPAAKPGRKAAQGPDPQGHGLGQGIPLDTDEEGHEGMAVVQTVQGPVDSGELGLVLVHEHVRFRDEAVAEEWPSMYDTEAELSAALEAVGAAKERGVETIVDPTAMFGGRDVRFMQAGGRAQTACKIVACTGIYSYDYLPHYFENRDVDAMAEHFVADIERGHPGDGDQGGVPEVRRRRRRG